jgi:hypothetical protein
MSTNGHALSSYPSRIDLSLLSQTGLDTLQQIAFRIYLGFNEREVAKVLHTTVKDVRGRMQQLRSELLSPTREE